MMFFPEKPVRGDAELSHYDVIGAIAQRNFSEGVNCAQQQAASDQQCKAERNLNRDQRRTHIAVMRCCAGAHPALPQFRFDGSMNRSKTRATVQP